MSQLLGFTEQGWLDDHQLRAVAAIEPHGRRYGARCELLCPAYIDTHVHGRGRGRHG